jgi:hypothetical protein
LFVSVICLVGGRREKEREVKSVGLKECDKKEGEGLGCRISWVIFSSLKLFSRFVRPYHAKSFLKYFK